MKQGGERLVIALVALAHACSHFFQIIVAPLFPLIKDELGVSYAALGFSMTLFYAISAVCQPVAGFVVDRFGARGVLLGGLGLMVAGIGVSGAATSYAALVAGSAIAGLGNAVFHPADFSILNSRVGAARLGYAYSAHGVAGSLGYAAAPLFSGGLGALFGWHAALYAAAGVGALVLVLLLANRKALDVKLERAEAGKGGAMDLRILFAAPVLLCFLYFAIYTAGLIGVQGFSVTAMNLQYGVSMAAAAAALTAYMLGTATGVLAGGFIAARASRHDLVAGGGLAAGSLVFLVIGLGGVPAGALSAALGLAGFCLGCTGPSRDMIVRAATPRGATGRIYGFVYSGLDVGSLATPVLYGWLVDHGSPEAVFLVVAGFTTLGMLTVLQVPGTARRAAAH